MKSRPAQKIFWIIISFAMLVLVVALYINRSYAYIYDKISAAGLKTFHYQEAYLINNMALDGASSGKLIANGEDRPSLVYSAVGDSLSAGVGAERYEESFPYLLAQKLANDNYQIILKPQAVPGVKTKDVLAGLLAGTIKDNPDIITILVGVNDIHGLISTSEFKNNYERILQRLTQETTAKIYVINIPFIGANKLLWPPHNYLFDLRTREFNEIIKELTDKYQVSYLDLYTPSHDLFKKSGSHYSADLFHPSASGYKIWADLIYDSINK